MTCSAPGIIQSNYLDIMSSFPRFIIEEIPLNILKLISSVGWGETVIILEVTGHFTYQNRRTL